MDIKAAFVNNDSGSENSIDGPVVSVKFIETLPGLSSDTSNANWCKATDQQEQSYKYYDA